MVELLGDGSDRELGADHKLPGGYLKIKRVFIPPRFFTTENITGNFLVLIF